MGVGGEKGTKRHPDKKEKSKEVSLLTDDMIYVENTEDSTKGRKKHFCYELLF